MRPPILAKRTQFQRNVHGELENEYECPHGCRNWYTKDERGGFPVYMECQDCAENACQVCMIEAEDKLS